MEAAPRYMLAEYLGETGRWDEALKELDMNSAGSVSPVCRRCSRGVTCHGSRPWRGDPSAADEALQRTRRSPRVRRSSRCRSVWRWSVGAAWLLWEGRVDEAVATAQEAVELGSLSAYDVRRAARRPLPGGG